MKVDRTGTFLATEIDRALGQTNKKGLPQLSIKMKLVHWFDNDLNDGAGDWVDFSSYEMETVGYFVLVFQGEKGPETSLSYEQLMKVYGWNGRDFQILTEMPAPEMFLVRIEDNDPAYADKNPYVVNWIDEATADPHGGLKKLDAAGITSLQSQFGALLNKTGKIAPPASAKKTPPTAPATAAKSTPAAPTVPGAAAVEPPKQTAADKKAAKKAKSAKVAEDNARLKAEEEAKATAVKAPPTSPTPPSAAPTMPPASAVTAPAEQTEEVKFCTKEEAFAFVYEMQAEGITDEARTAAWNAAIKQIAGDADHKDITGEQWHQIMHETLNDVGAV